MTTRLTRFSALLLSGLALSFSACSNDDDDSTPTPTPEPGTIPEVAEQAGDFSTLLTAVGAAGLADELSGEGPFTVFAPTDAAFAALPEGALDDLLADTAALTDVLLYHVVSGELASSDVVERSTLTMLNGDDAEIMVDGSRVMIDGARITMTDIPASNGVIHVIDAVMLPPEDAPEPGNIAEVAAAAGNFTTLLAAVDAAGLTDALVGPGPLTVFAPTDAAFAALPEGAVEALLGDTDELRDVLLYHVVDGRQDAAQVVSEERITTLLGPWVEVVVDGATVTVGGATIVATDIEASNGLIHVIDAVILPPPKMADLVVATDGLSTLEAAVVAAGLVDTLNGAGPFTVFAPTNDAFAALPAGTLDSLLADTDALTNVLTYHVVSGRVTAEMVAGMGSVTTLQGSDAAIVAGAEGVTIAGQAVTQVDIQARNGIVHLIGGVMLPPSM